MTTTPPPAGFTRLFFNVNDRMGVKLTDRGRSILRNEEHVAAVQKLYHDFDPVYKTEADGYAGEQCWPIMRSLGSACGNGVELPFEAQVRFNSADLYIDEDRKVSVAEMLTDLYAACKAMLRDLREARDTGACSRSRDAQICDLAAALAKAVGGE